MKRGLIVAATLLAVSGPAFAGQCPALMNKVDEAMQSAMLSDADKQRVEALRQSGEEAHAAGDHAQSEADLNQALAILGVM